jgi:ribosomal protein S26
VIDFEIDFRSRSGQRGAQGLVECAKSASSVLKERAWKTRQWQSTVRREIA